jgi:hypothetical protein
LSAVYVISDDGSAAVTPIVAVALAIVVLFAIPMTIVGVGTTIIAAAIPLRRGDGCRAYKGRGC